MKKKLIITLLCCFFSISAFSQYTMKSYEGKVFSNTNKPDMPKQGDYGGNDYIVLANEYFMHVYQQYKFNTDNGKTETQILELHRITYGDLMILLEDVENPQVYLNGSSQYCFTIGKRYNDKKLVFKSTHYPNSPLKKEKVDNIYIDFKTKDKAEAQAKLDKIITKAKEVTSKQGYVNDRTIFEEFAEDEKDKIVTDALDDIDLDLTTDEEKAAKAAKDRELRAQQIASYKPIYFKKGDEIIFSIYYDETTASSLNTKIYRGDKAKLLFTTYKNVYTGQLSKTAQFENCSYCSIYSIIDVGSRVIPIKNKPNSIQYQMMFKDNYWYLIKGTGTNTEVDYNSNFEKLEICNTKDDGDIYGKCSLSIESEFKLNAKTKLWVMAMLHMAGYIADDGSFGE